MRNKTLLYLVILIGIFSACKSKNTSQATDENTVDSLIWKIDFLKKETYDKTLKIDSLQKEITSIKTKKDSVPNNWFDPNFEAESLVKQGIKNPQTYIEDALIKKNLIPIKGVLGGNMNFGSMQVLGSKWVIAYYDDGHIMGKSIYQYQLKKDGKIDFKILDSDIP